MNFQVYRELFLLGLGSDIALLFCAQEFQKKQFGYVFLTVLSSSSPSFL